MKTNGVETTPLSQTLLGSFARVVTDLAQLESDFGLFGLACCRASLGRIWQFFNIFFWHLAIERYLAKNQPSARKVSEEGQR